MYVLNYKASKYTKENLWNYKEKISKSPSEQKILTHLLSNCEVKLTKNFR